jgi:hypothetical protein
MSTSRRWFISGFLIFLIAGHVYDIVVDREHWPLSQYPMFSRVWTSASFGWHRAVGVDDEGHEVVLRDRDRIHPFDNSRLHLGLERMRHGRQAGAMLNEAAADLLERYERLRREGGHDGPPLTALRLYRFEWTLDPDIRNVDTPDRRVLLAEAR